MKSRDVVGKRIVRIYQSVKSLGTARGRANTVDGLRLEDGTLLTFQTVETDHGTYLHDVIVRRAAGV